MQFFFKPQNIEIELSWKERFVLFFKGKLSLNRLNSYKLNAGLLKICADNSLKYGDSKEHGQLDRDV
tara:strand:+ start:940 stop:1140 length:201 start_codon:yes stop_codon:yes gene_type:complete